MSNKIIVNFCPTGMIPNKVDTQHVPISPEEIIEQVHESYEIGITMVHLHARQENGVPTWQPHVYQKIFEGVRKYCPELIICGSTSGRNFSEFEKRSAVIELEPDMCSLTLSSLNFMKHASVNAPDIVQKLALKMKDFGVSPELECFDLGMINYGNYLISKGYVEGPYYWNLLFGNIAGMQNNFLSIGAAVAQIPKGHFISLAGLGRSQLSVNASAIAQGYGVRVGLEDNIYFNVKRKEMATNTDLVKRVHNLIEINQNEFFTPKEFGELGFYNTKRNKPVRI